MLMAALQLHKDSSATTTPPWPPHRPRRPPPRLLSTPAPSTPCSLLGVGPCSARNHRVVKTKRRPRPSRRLPTTYISADPASFRRMVQQVTGADDLPPQEEPTKMNAAELLISRPAPIKQPSRTTGTEMLLPMLDTSAFLTSCDGSSPPALKAEAPAGGASCSGGFPTLDSWDHHALLF